MRELTTTSYAILGLLNVRPHSAYELAAQSQRSLRFVWPTAPSRLYAEPKRLAGAGLITVSEEPAGPTRTRQQYRITQAGRRALAAWLETEPSTPRVEAEILLRVLFADAGSPEDLVAALQATRERMVELNDDGRRIVDSYVDGDNPFPERLHLNLLWILLVRDLYQLLHDWTLFAENEVNRWNDADEQQRDRRADALLRAISQDELLIDRQPMPRTPPLTEPPT